jgi:hypothetical protein
LFGLGIPQGEIKNAQGEVVFPTNALERLLQGSAGPTSDFAAAFMGPGTKMVGGGVRLSGPPRTEADWLTQLMMARQRYADNANPSNAAMITSPYERALINQRMLNAVKPK